MGVQNPRGRACRPRCGEVMGEKLDLTTLLIQRDLSQNFFCEISNFFWLSRLGNQSNVAKGKMQHHSAVCNGVAFADTGNSRPSVLWLESRFANKSSQSEGN